MKYVLDGIRNYLIIWFCLVVGWYLAELVEPGIQFADPVGPNGWVALIASATYTFLRYATENFK